MLRIPAHTRAGRRAPWCSVGGCGISWSAVLAVISSGFLSRFVLFGCIRQAARYDRNSHSAAVVTAFFFFFSSSHDGFGLK